MFIFYININMSEKQTLSSSELTLPKKLNMIELDDYRIDIHCTEFGSRKYFIGEQIGTGMYGSVYKAVDENGKEIAIKIIFMEILHDPVTINKWRKADDEVMEENVNQEIKISRELGSLHIGPEVYYGIICPNVILYSQHQIIKYLPKFKDLLTNVSQFNEYLNKDIFVKYEHIVVKLEKLSLLSQIYIEFPYKLVHQVNEFINLIKKFNSNSFFNEMYNKNFIVKIPLEIIDLLQQIDELLNDIITSLDVIMKFQKEHKLENYWKINEDKILNENLTGKTVRLGMIFMEKLDTTLGSWIETYKDSSFIAEEKEKLRDIYVKKSMELYKLNYLHPDIHEANIMLNIDAEGKPTDLFIIDFGELTDLNIYKSSYFNPYENLSEDKFKEDFDKLFDYICSIL
jgi:serine/threonine protein kinase